MANSYAECSPATMDDMTVDCDEEVDYSKMDQGDKKGPLGRWDFDTQEEYNKNLPFTIEQFHFSFSLIYSSYTCSSLQGALGPWMLSVSLVSEDPDCLLGVFLLFVLHGIRWAYGCLQTAQTMRIQAAL
ncbi:protein Red-like protein [Cricetulus griseus]|nr:protein Red-like protein [Cricetulus griseus]